MQYKTIVLELLEQNPELYEQLRSKRTLLPAVNHYSTELKTKHEAWIEKLFQTKPESDLNQIKSEAMEIALKELQDRLLAESQTDENTTLSLEGAIAHIRQYIQPA